LVSGAKANNIGQDVYGQLTKYILSKSFGLEAITYQYRWTAITCDW